MNIHQLECLITIVNTGTISKAAEVMNFTQPALTRTLKSLEDELGYPLFDREKKKLVLNETGKIAVKHAQKILKIEHEMINEIDAYQKNKERISIGSCAPAPLWGIKQILQKKFPYKTIDSVILEDNVELIEGFNDHKYSLLILDYPIHNKNLVSVKLFEETLYVAVKKDDSLSSLESITFDQLDGNNLLVLSKTGYWSEICKEHLPHSLMLAQEDIKAYKTLLKVSSLATLRTNITIPKFKNIEDRIYIPITDPEATLSFYAMYSINDSYSITKEDLNSIPWENYRNEDCL